ncbi:MAG: exonuclease [Clostridiales bacterium]|nr:exonuclease [Clostridiales bacterium]
MDFIAVDFETATERYDSACSVGIAAVAHLEVVETFYSLIKPPDSVFTRTTTLVHGIRAQDVVNAPSFDELFPVIAKYFQMGVPIAAHNAVFDMSVLKNALKSEVIDFDYFDSITVARGYIGGSKSLKNCAGALSIPLDNHHNAAADAVTCAKVVIEILKMAGCAGIGEYLAQNKHVRLNRFSELCADKTYHFAQRKPRYQRFPNVRPADIVPQTDDADESHPLFGKSIVFTGELSVDRAIAMQNAVNVGAVIKSTVSKNTDYLVVGKQDIKLVGNTGISTKEEKAYKLINSGLSTLCVIRENEFLSLIAGKKDDE